MRSIFILPLAILAIAGFVSSARQAPNGRQIPAAAADPQPDPGYRSERESDPYRPPTSQHNQQSFSVSAQHSAHSNGAICTGIKTANGVVSGKLVKSKTGRDVCAFLGIPYAKPPIGDLRFQRPVPRGNWEGTLDVTTLPNTCWQPVDESSKGSDFYPNTKLSEDCLYLNLWVPLSAIRNKDAQSASTMIWIHGGALTTGSGSFDLYNGEIFASDQEVILAAINYRLGPFGFLFLNCPEAPGTMGLIDQHMAIKWIKENVPSFGGNSDEITIFGESAGSMSVAHHLLSPMSKGLFKRAILQSGVSIGPTMYWDPEDALIAGYDFSQQMGCSAKGRAASQDVTEIVKCLQGMDASKLANFNPTTRKFLDFSGAATVDGYFLPDTPKNLLKDLEVGARADIMIGVVKNEGSLFLFLDGPIAGYFPIKPSPPTISYDTFVTVLHKVFRQKSVYEQDAIISRYTNWVNIDDSAQNLRRLIEAIGDYVIACPSMDLAAHWAARGHRVYAYDFTQRSSASPFPEWFGVMHQDDIEFAFGRVGSQATRPEPERQLSREMNRIWADFAKTGIPAEKWESWTKARQVYVDFNATTIASQTTPNHLGPRAEACAFWNNDLPLLKKIYENAHSNRTGALPPLPSAIPTEAQLQLMRSSGQCATPGGGASNQRDSNLPPSSCSGGGADNRAAGPGPVQGPPCSGSGQNHAGQHYLPPSASDHQVNGGCKAAIRSV